MGKPDSPSAPPPDLSRLLPWWTRPSALNLLFILPVLLAVFWGGGTDFIASESRTPSYLSVWYMALCVGLVLVSALGAWLGEHMQQRSLLQSPVQHLVRAAVVVGIVVLATYLFWYRTVVGNPAVLIAVLTGSFKPERNDIGTLVGITSLVNLAPLFFSLAGYLLFVRRTRDRTLIVLTVVLLLFTLFRAYLWSERLAAVEAVIPLTLALIGSSAAKPRRRVVSNLLHRLGPYAALPAIFLLFAVAEYFRSWPYYEDRMAFWDFALGRFVSYYYTSINNGAGMLATASDWPTATFEHVLFWLHSFPLGVGQWFSEAVGLYDSNRAGAVFLERYGDPEFNTPSSFASVTSDLGVAGAIVYFFASMFCAGILFARYAKGDPLALMLYPSVLVALFESLRYCYWGASRAFVWFLGTVIVLVVLWACGAISTARSPRHAARTPIA